MTFEIKTKTRSQNPKQNNYSNCLEALCRPSEKEDAPLLSQTGSKKVFTLVELVVAMGVFAIIMFVLISFFSSTQKAWLLSSQKTETFENARIAMDLISRDLQCTYYVYARTPFWHKGFINPVTYPAWINHWGEGLYFISATSSPPNASCNSRLCEIAYQLYAGEDPSVSTTYEGWLTRSATGDMTDAPADNTYRPATDPSPNVAGRWGFDNNFTCNYNNAIGVPPDGGALAFTGETAGDTAVTRTSCEAYRKIIPNVVQLHFTCYDRAGNELTPDTTGTTMTPLPYSVQVELTLLDGTSWAKWKQLGGTPYNADLDIAIPAAHNLRINNQRVFTKTILLGERGQYQ